jgi:hypothetical protein
LSAGLRRGQVLNSRTDTAFLRWPGQVRAQKKEKTMKPLSILSAIAAITLSAAPIVAAEKAPGASKYSPGHEMQSETGKSTAPGASEYTPGDQSKDTQAKSTAPGASE